LETFTEFILGFENFSSAVNFGDKDTVCFLQSFVQESALEWLESLNKTPIWKISPTYATLKSKMREYFENRKTEMGTVMELEAVKTNSTLQEYVVQFRFVRRSVNVTDPTTLLWFRRNLNRLLEMEKSNFVATDLESLIRYTIKIDKKARLADRFIGIAQVPTVTLKIIIVDT
jgi:Retrotransposon gag protein